MPEALVLVGRRRKALEAAEALGIPVVLISERPVADSGPIIGWSPQHTSGHRDSLLKLTDYICSKATPKAVVALTERAVVPAAEIREALGLAGQTAAAATVCVDKLIMKRAIRSAGLPCADFCAADEEMHRQDLIERLGLPMIIKPRIGSGSRGTRLVTNPSDVPERLAESDLAERLIGGKEMSIESFVVNGEVLFSSVSDYFEPRWANIVPGTLNETQRSQVVALNSAVLNAVSLEEGITHMEFFLQERRVVFGEIAARPPGGHLMELIGHAWGFDPWQALVRIAMGESASFPQAPGTYAGTRLWHPGPGVVEHIEGIAKLAAIPSVRQIKLLAYPGRRYEARSGVGEEAGHIIVADPDLACVQATLRKAAQCVRFRMRRN